MIEATLNLHSSKLCYKVHRNLVLNVVLNGFCFLKEHFIFKYFKWIQIR
jgi:hypothetical protein